MHGFVARSSKSKCTKHTTFGPLLDVEASFCVACARDSTQNVMILKCFQSAGRREAFEEDLQRCMSCGRRSTRDTWVRDVRRSRRDFLRGVAFLEHQIFRFGQMILCDRCSTSYDLASLFRGRRSTSGRWNGEKHNALARGRQLRTQLSIFEGSHAELLPF